MSFKPPYSPTTKCRIRFPLSIVCAPERLVQLVSDHFRPASPKAIPGQLVSADQAYQAVRKAPAGCYAANTSIAGSTDFRRGFSGARRVGIVPPRNAIRAGSRIDRVAWPPIGCRFQQVEPSQLKRFFRPESNCDRRSPNHWSATTQQANYVETRG